MPVKSRKEGVLDKRNARQALAKKSQKSVLPKVLGLLVVLFAVLSFIYFLNQEKEFKRQQSLNAHYVETLASLEEENIKLEKDKENINSDENVMKIAHEQGMIREGEIIFEDSNGN